MIVFTLRKPVGSYQAIFPKPHGVPRVDGRRVLSGIIHVLKPGLQWRNAPARCVGLKAC